MTAQLDALINTSQTDFFGNTHFFNENGQIIASYLSACPSFFIRNYLPNAKSGPINATGPVALVYAQPVKLNKRNGINRFHPYRVAFGAINTVQFETQVIVDHPTREFILIHSYCSVFEQANPHNVLAKEILEYMISHSSRN